MASTLRDTAPPAAPAPRPAGRARSAGTWSRDRIETAVLRVLRWLVIAALLLVTVFPFYYMLLLSVRNVSEVVLNPGALVVSPSEIQTETYATVLKSVSQGGQGFLGLMRNSAFVAIVTVLVTLAVSIPGSYAVSRLQFFGRRPISFLFLAVYLFPVMVLAIPLYVFFTRVGLRGSLLGLAIVYVAQTVPVAIYMLRNYFETIPQSLEEAGFIDGLTHLGVIRRISLPLAMPSVMATALYVFMIAWNEFLFALLFLIERRPRWTVSLGLSQLSGSIEIPTTILMAGSVVLTVPIIVLFFAAERLLVEGLTSGAEKG